MDPPPWQSRARLFIFLTRKRSSTHDRTDPGRHGRPRGKAAAFEIEHSPAASPAHMTMTCMSRPDPCSRTPGTCSQSKRTACFLSPTAASWPISTSCGRPAQRAPRVVYLVNPPPPGRFITAGVNKQNRSALFAACSQQDGHAHLEKVRMGPLLSDHPQGAGKTYLSTCSTMPGHGRTGKHQGFFLEAWSEAPGPATELRIPSGLVNLQGPLASARDILIHPVVISYSNVRKTVPVRPRPPPAG
jgi:hypothetical protein